MIDLDVCACSGKNLARLLRPALMAAVAHGPIHGYRIAQHLKAMPMFAAHPPDHAGIYRALKEMENESLLTSQWDLEESGPAKRLYKLTSTGMRCLARWQRTVEEYMDALKHLLSEISQVVEERQPGARGAP